jgi:hypothetical protein
MGSLLASADTPSPLLTTQTAMQAVREERMGVLNKKQKQEEDKMRTNEESFSTQSKRLKEKLRSVAQGGRQAGKEGGRSK